MLAFIYMVTTFGIVASSLTTACWVPQVYKTLHTRTAKDFSWLYLFTFTVGILGWLVYGLMLHNYIIWISNGAVGLCALFIIMIKSLSIIGRGHSFAHDGISGTPE